MNLRETKGKKRKVTKKMARKVTQKEVGSEMIKIKIIQILLFLML